MEKSLGLHETLDMHEILTFKNICLTKSAAMAHFAQDPALKSLLSHDAQQTQQDIGQLLSFLGGQKHE
ncbi:hypothetical protein [Heyndrickxia acidiproducens]|uniref:hypothetical protein n=1 Tax=Heyndrickxia acidiproducens TaxID=1121084 RepID=UPI0003734EB2|nr:hypothetical protein [Heyndrickxia acidiproducens]